MQEHIECVRLCVSSVREIALTDGEFREITDQVALTGHKAAVRDARGADGAVGAERRERDSVRLLRTELIVLIGALFKIFVLGCQKTSAKKRSGCCFLVGVTSQDLRGSFFLKAKCTEVYF